MNVCGICGRPINHKGNCLGCNIKKNKTGGLEKINAEFGSVENFLKSLLEENDYGERLWLRRKQNNDKFFREYIFKKYGDICFLCKRRLTPLKIHHKSYEILCQPIRKRRGYSKVKRNTCRNCMRSHRELFEKCTNNVLLICNKCHKNIHFDENGNFRLNLK
jgi:hypothetical protein